MKKFFTSLAMLGSIGLSFPAHSQMGMMGPGCGMGAGCMMGRGNGMMGMSMVRYHFVMMNGINPEYAAKENPLQPSIQNIEKGRKLYDQNCARCHGATGLGDGEAGKTLNPRPANIAAASKMPMATDSYLYWTIAEGGTPIGTAMPPFLETLKEEDIWKVITYLRAL